MNVEIDPVEKLHKTVEPFIIRPMRCVCGHTRERHCHGQNLHGFCDIYGCTCTNYQYQPDIQRDLDTELVRDDIHNAVASEWKNMPLVRTGPGGFYTADYDPKVEPINWLNVLLVATCVICGGYLCWVCL